MNRRIFVFDILGLGVFSIIKNKIKFIKNTGMVRSVSTWKTSDANLKAGQLLDKGSNSLDAAVEGVAVGCFPDLYGALSGNMPDQVISL